MVPTAITERIRGACDASALRQFGLIMRRLIVVCLFFLAGSLHAAPAEALFVVIADQHSAYDRTAQFVAHVARVKAENPGVPLAVLVNGDSLELGNVVAQRSGGEIDLAMFAALARIAPTVVNLGNHEPDLHAVPEIVEKLRTAGVNVIGNLRDRTSGELFAPASIVLPLGETEVVIAGVTTDQLSQYRAAVRPALDLAVPAVWAKEKFPAIFNAAAPGAAKIVLSHAGLRLDRGMFPHVPDGALFAGAHDHAQFVKRLGRTVYFHSGSWNGHFSLARLERDTAGAAHWTVAQQAMRASDPANAELEKRIRDTNARHLTADDLAPVGRLPGELSRAEAARFVVAAVRAAAGVDAAFIGNTTFGDGLPTGDVSRVALNACVRFDGTLCVAEVSGERLRALLARSNQGPDTPFAEREGESLFAVGPEEIDAGKTYRMATTDWGMKNRGRYFGTDDLAFVEHPELRLKAVVAEALRKR